MAFFQDPPRLGNQFDDDALLREYLARALPPDLLARIEPELRELGGMAGGELFAAQLEDRQNDPKLVGWDPWGKRIDRIELSPLWKRAKVITAERGLVATAYERRDHQHSRVHMFALNYLVQASLDVYSCPLAMTDGAARTLLDLDNKPLVERAVPRLTSRDPAAMWTSGQWMTERTGGSDVGLSETVARRGDDGEWRLFGNKFFTSAATSEMALTLGRPEGNGPGGRGLALYYVEVKRPDGTSNSIVTHRLKDKLGTRKVPTAELELEGTLAVPVAGLGDGVRNISSMLNITRTWNAGGAIWGMRRAIALARDYATRRVQFGARLADKPLHADTLAGIEAEFAGAFLLTFRAIELLGRREAGVAGERETLLWRVVTPLAKLTTGKQAVAVSTEAIECIGGAGYMEDTGFPLLVRDAQVLPIWEGTTNVLSLDVLRALAKEGTLEALGEEIATRLAAGRAAGLGATADVADRAMNHARAWLVGALADRDRLEAGARRLALTLGRTLELALLVEHAALAATPRATADARRFARAGVDLITDDDVG